jgi:hypothetical protein
LIELHRTKDFDLDEMCGHFEELALLLQTDIDQQKPSRERDKLLIVESLESLRLEICEYLNKFKQN